MLHDIMTMAPKANWEDFRVLPIDVLFYEGQIARSYLEMLYSLRCKPRRIIRLIAKRDLVTKEPVGRFLPLFLRNKYSAIVQTQKYITDQNISFAHITNYAWNYLISLVKH